jgi:hypothetical protein
MTPGWTPPGRVPLRDAASLPTAAEPGLRTSAQVARGPGRRPAYRPRHAGAR